MKGFYIDNLVLRVVFCVAGFYAIWFGMSFVIDTFIRHQPMSVGILDILVPLVLGILEAFQWKPKD